MANQSVLQKKGHCHKPANFQKFSHYHLGRQGLREASFRQPWTGFLRIFFSGRAKYSLPLRRHKRPNFLVKVGLLLWWQARRRQCRWCAGCRNLVHSCSQDVHLTFSSVHCLLDLHNTRCVWRELEVMVPAISWHQLEELKKEGVPLLHNYSRARKELRDVAVEARRNSVCQLLNSVNVGTLVLLLEDPEKTIDQTTSMASHRKRESDLTMKAS